MQRETQQQAIWVWGLELLHKHTQLHTWTDRLTDTPSAARGSYGKNDGDYAAAAVCAAMAAVAVCMAVCSGGLQRPWRKTAAMATADCRWGCRWNEARYLYPTWEGGQGGADGTRPLPIPHMGRMTGWCKWNEACYLYPTWEE